MRDSWRAITCRFKLLNCPPPARGRIVINRAAQLRMSMYMGARLAKSVLAAAWAACGGRTIAEPCLTLGAREAVVKFFRAWLYLSKGAALTAASLFKIELAVRRAEAALPN